MYHYPIVPAPVTVVTKETLSEALHAAIDNDDIDQARAALEEAFWRKIVFTPDIFHLCRALHRQDRDLVRLLVTYGAKPDAVETKAAAQFLSQKQIDVEPLLRGTGLSLSPSADIAAASYAALLHDIEITIVRKSLKASFDKIGLGKKTKEILATSTGIELNAQQTLAVIDDLFKNIKDDAVPHDFVAALSLLKQTKADFTSIDANRYLGKKAPGLAKTLLDAGVIGADAFDMRMLIKKVGGEIKIFTAREDKNYAYTEFLCQVSLEIADPRRFTPLRSEPDDKRMYQKHFCDKWVRDDNADLTYRLKGPKPPK